MYALEKMYRLYIICAINVYVYIYVYFRFYISSDKQVYNSIYTKVVQQVLSFIQKEEP